MGDFVPGFARIGAAIDPTGGAELHGGIIVAHAIWRLLANIAIKGVALPFPERGDERIRLGWMHGDVDAAGLVVEIKDLFPGLATIGSLEDAALGIGPIEPAKRTNEDNVGVS